MIVFLDKDGVFETSRCYAAGMKIDPVAVRALNHLFDSPRVRVVISATFRKIMKSRTEASLYLKERGIECNLHEHWRTPSAPSRSLEIRQWLDANNETNYLVIDDEHCDPSLLDPARFIKCNPNNGMDLAALSKLRDICTVI